MLFSVNTSFMRSVLSFYERLKWTNIKLITFSDLNDFLQIFNCLSHCQTCIHKYTQNEYKMFNTLFKCLFLELGIKTKLFALYE